MKLKLFTIGKNDELDYTHGSEQFLIDHNLEYTRSYYSLHVLALSPDGVEVQAETVPELQILAAKYNAAIVIEENGITIEFMWDIL